jgi:hypothetical protein
MHVKRIKGKNKDGSALKRLKTHRVPAHVSLAERRQRELFRSMTPAQRWEQFKALRGDRLEIETGRPRGGKDSRMHCGKYNYLMYLFVAVLICNYF